MSGPLPDALRARFQQYIEEGLSGRAAALRLKLSPGASARSAMGACDPADGLGGGRSAGPAKRPGQAGPVAKQAQKADAAQARSHLWAPRREKRCGSTRELVG